MSLREQVAAAILPYELPTSTIDAAITTFEQAMLQPEVITALLEAVEDDSILAMALSANKQAGRPIANEASIEMGRKWMQAALAAMTGAEGERE